MLSAALKPSQEGGASLTTSRLWPQFFTTKLFITLKIQRRGRFVKNWRAPFLMVSNFAKGEVDWSFRNIFSTIFFKWSNPDLFFIYVCSFQTQLQKNLKGFSGIWNWNVVVEGEHADHLTTTKAHFQIKFVYALKLKNIELKQCLLSSLTVRMYLKMNALGQWYVLKVGGQLLVFTWSVSFLRTATIW